MSRPGQMIETLVLFGATGDLARRYVLPALSALHSAGELPAGFRVVGAARQELDDEAFRHAAAQALEEHAADVPAAARRELLGSLSYRAVDLEDGAGVAAVLAGHGALAAYLALPPGVFGTAVTALRGAGPAAGSRIVLEKPFGEDLASATALNALLADAPEGAGDDAIYRVDHVLGLATVQNLLAMRLSNPVLEAVWNSAHVERVDILWEETLALEGRAGYYDRAGALKDVVQNHMLQVMCLVAMEPPATLAQLHDRKVDVLRAVRPLREEDAASRTRRARYAAGRIGERSVPAYVEEEGVDPARGTETFAEVTLEIDNPRWSGTVITLRAGKALRQRRKEAVVRFRPGRSPFGDAAPNELRIGVDGPEDIALRLTGATAGNPPQAAELTLSAAPPPSGLPAYSRVLLDVLRGGSNLSVRGDEAELAWRVVTPVLEAWSRDRVPLGEYQAGSCGPPPLAGRR
jgi:glucose-6-phosphate 1-dehydrogenase